MRTDPDLFISVVTALEPTFGAINLEDIKAPECFAIEAALRARMKIPVFHDDQHGTAITVAAAVHNALMLQNKTLADLRLVTSGAGAAALACVDLLVAMGLNPENVTLTDIKGVVYEGRETDMAPNMARYARRTDARALPDVLAGADIFLGLSAPRVLKPEWLAQMAERPIIMALANPDPEITPAEARAARPDAIVATGRSDFPNQVNNVLCFPFIFRGALDVAATTINEEMKLAAVHAIAELARLEASEVVASAYGGLAPVFGPDYIIPKTLRSALDIACGAGRGACRDRLRRGAAPDRGLGRLSRGTGAFSFSAPASSCARCSRAARKRPARIVYAEGEDERVLRAVQLVIDEHIAEPTLIGRRDVITRMVGEMGLRMRLGEQVHVIDPAQDRAVFDPLMAPYQRLSAAARRAAGCRRTPHPQSPDRGRGDAAADRPGGCGPVRRHRRLVAGRWNTCCRSFPNAPMSRASMP